MKLLIILTTVFCLASASMPVNRVDEALLAAKPKPKLSSDKSYFVMTEVSIDSTYGYTASNPIKVGYNGIKNAVQNEKKYLNGLTGPKGEKISYYRIGSCCNFKSKKAEGLLDKYRVEWSDDSGDKEAVFFINMYEYEDVKVPVGFTIKKY